VGACGVGLEAAGEIESIHAGKLQVHQDEERFEALEDGQCLLRVGGRTYLEARACQHDTRELEVGGVVVDDQDRLTGHPAS
jgi:hypothetical protein